jgi:hypothetical protein
LAVAVFLAIALVSAGLAAVTGFGTATVLTPFAALVMPLEEAIVLVAVFHFLANSSRLWLLRSHIHPRTALIFGLPSLAASALGALALTALSGTRPLRLAFGLFLLSYSVSALLGRSWRLPSSDRALAAGGLLAGFVSGLIGLGGAIRGAFLIALPLGKEAYVATSASIAVAVDVARLTVYIPWGVLSPASAWLLGPLVLCAFAGSWAGRKALGHLREDVLRRIVLSALFVVSFRFLLG